jgi:guanine deaminase
MMANPFMARAIDLAIENVRSRRGGPFGAVVVKDGKIIAEAANGVTTANDPTAHAEVLAIRAACAKLGLFELRGCELYTSCEPCPMCLGAIYWARPDRVYFGGSAADASRVGFDDSLIYREIAQPHSARKIPMIQLMRDEALETFRAWEHQPNKIPY